MLFVIGDSLGNVASVEKMFRPLATCAGLPVTLTVLLLFQQPPLQISPELQFRCTPKHRNGLRSMGPR